MNWRSLRRDPSTVSCQPYCFHKVIHFKFVDIAHYHIQCIYLKGLSGPMRHHFPAQLKPSTKTREKWSRWMGSLENVCGVEEEVRGGSLHTWWCVSDQSNSVPTRAEALGSWKMQMSHQPICASPFPLIHILFLPPLLVCLPLIVRLVLWCPISYFFSTLQQKKSVSDIFVLYDIECKMCTGCFQDMAFAKVSISLVWKWMSAAKYY